MTAVDVVRPRSSKQRFLFALPGRIPASVINGVLGEVTHLDTSTPGLVLQTATVRSSERVCVYMAVAVAVAVVVVVVVVVLTKAKEV
jgi:hypothetical protein